MEGKTGKIRLPKVGMTLMLLIRFRGINGGGLVKSVKEIVGFVTIETKIPLTSIGLI